ncbi:unnamed protein product [Prorocentrum cordatum]|uniref:Uncharacterized protein n=1 Tax=Prorocentrum cordatum TaxID=2364126 RepID=A0ABN9WAA3_9DINO|nr:unnamed protein product [Polarella glacialis]
MQGSPVAASCSSRRPSAARGSFCSSLSSAPGSPAWPAQPPAPSSSAASSAATTPALRPVGSASPQLLGEPEGGARRSPKPGGWPGAGRGTHASEVKAQRLKATKNRMRSEMRDKGNLLFADLLHWLKSVEAVPLDRLAALVEEVDLPQLCRLDFWGLPCPGCGLRHRSGAAAAGALPQSPARLWGGARQLAAKASPWMRSPPHLPGFSRQTLEEVHRARSATRKVPTRKRRKQKQLS